MKFLKRVCALLLLSGLIPNAQSQETLSSGKFSKAASSNIDECQMWINFGGHEVQVVAYSEFAKNRIELHLKQEFPAFSSERNVKESRGPNFYHFQKSYRRARGALDEYSPTPLIEESLDLQETSLGFFSLEYSIKGLLHSSQPFFCDQLKRSDSN